MNFDQIKDLQQKILNYVDGNDDDLSDDCILINYLKNRQIEENSNDLNLILRFISKILKNHHRSSDFYLKIENIISSFSETIKQQFSNYDIFNIFKGNKRILLYLFTQKIIIPDKNIVNIIASDKYSKKGYLNYFIDVIKSYINENLAQKIENENNSIESNQEIFEEKRKASENDSFICQLIRNDSVEDFISHVNTKSIPLTLKIPKSIFETNTFLIDKDPSLIEYAAFFGSIQIFKYLVMSKLKVNSSLFFYAIHGRNPEMIHILEECNLGKLDKTFFMDCIKEAIKCHHNEIAEYFVNNFIENSSIDDASVFTESVRSYNYEYFPTCLINEFVFDDLCRYNYVNVVEFLLKNEDVDVNKCNIFDFDLF